VNADKHSPAAPLPVVPAKVASEHLLGSRRELLIAHNGRDYRLRVTRSGKLILTA
jgi:hemin uptake protein HemP